VPWKRRVSERQDRTSPAQARRLLEVEDLTKLFPVRRGVFGRIHGHVHAVEGVSFALAPRETLGIVGESGCGKSTLARMIVRLIEPSGGKIRFEGVDITALSSNGMHRYRRDIQFVFQDPYASLNPRLRALKIVGEALENYDIARGRQLGEHVAALFQKVGLRPDQLRHYPHEFSGGQRQRLGLARALALNPRIIIADEPVSALDVSVQAQVINLMVDLQREFGLAYLFIAHDLAVVQHISHRVAVMYLGRIVELADKRALFSDPIHPYTEALLDAVPVPDPALRREKAVLSGEVPSPMRPPPGCRFHTRCPLAEARCRVETPAMVEARPGHFVACHVRAPGGARRIEADARPAAAIEKGGKR
jgi:oligopeptide/dipeptide ABC transporter ATP-binding protein